MLAGRVLVVFMLACSPAAFADSFDVNMNNTAVQVKYGASASDIGDGNAEFQGRFLYNDAGNRLADVGLKVKGGGSGEEGPGLIAGGGVKGLYGAINQGVGVPAISVSCIAVNAELGVSLPSTIPISLIGEYSVATKIMSFADAERYDEFVLRVEAVITPQAKIYYGYREIGFGIKNVGSVLFDSGTYAGMTLTFE